MSRLLEHVVVVNSFPGAACQRNSLVVGQARNPAQANEMESARLINSRLMIKPFNQLVRPLPVFPEEMQSIRKPLAK